MSMADWQIERDVKITPFAKGEKRPGKISYGLGSYGYDVRLGYKFKVFTPAYCTGAVIDPKAIDDKSFIEIDLTPNPKHDWDDKVIPVDSNPNPQYRCKRCGFTTFVKDIPKDWKTNYCGAKVADHVIIPPGGFVLGESIEHFDIPRDVIVVALGKSTYARCGILVNVTPGEPEWKGHWTIEISNTAPLPAKVYAGEGIMQCLFFRSDGKREMLETVVVSKVFGGINPLEVDGTCLVSYADKKGKYQDQGGLTLPKVDGDAK